MADREKLMLALKSTEVLAGNGLHDQSVWIKKEECGTRCCFAGNWAIVSGMEVVGTPHRQNYKVINEQGYEELVPDWVAKDLGLSVGQANLLFYDSVDIEELRFHVEMILKLQDHGLDDMEMDDAIAEYMRERETYSWDQERETYSWDQEDETYSLDQEDVG